MFLSIIIISLFNAYYYEHLFIIIKILRIVLIPLRLFIIRKEHYLSFPSHPHHSLFPNFFLSFPPPLLPFSSLYCTFFYSVLSSPLPTLPLFLSLPPFPPISPSSKPSQSPYTPPSLRSKPSPTSYPLALILLGQKTMTSLFQYNKI